ncbi:CAMK family protein kinase [Tritrichomonas foetus]|uniref:CAMK family protein kinase n=1 Tax=Tritrichomonas foetus TaxID=1144522 RepID=A0A1J4K4W9_9EUKA|nr:CAMK family protein kinase [Tritrichomonas foetus]|eukprot:OHT04726.1 CAMK family protein kinase [Tritrichomonas foetus]
MGCCCGVPKVVNEVKKKNPSRVGRSSKLSACENSSGYFSDDYQENPAPRYFNFKQFFEESQIPSLNGYRFIKIIGYGAMSSVYLAEAEDTKEEFAAKVYNMTQLLKPTLGNEEPPIAAVQREILLMSQMSHLYILGIVDAFDDYDTNSRILFFPFADYGNLQSVIDKNAISEKNIAVCFHQIAVGLQYMHSLNIVHRDIKPENILCFREDYYVLSDFSVSAQLNEDDQLFDDTKGSPAFLSPEECSGDPFMPKPADVWAYGVSLYSAVFKKLPFNLDEGQNRSIANTVMIVTEMLETQSLTFPTDRKVDPNLKKLLKDVLNKDPKARPTFDKIERYSYFKDAWPINEANFLEEQLLIKENDQE